MSKQFAVVVVAALGLVGCGGGGGSSGGGSDDQPGASTGGVKASDLVGTWVQTNQSYTETVSGGREWFQTRRQTMIIEQVESGLRFTNCVTGEALHGSLSNDVVTFPVQEGLDEPRELDVADASRITGAFENATDNTETDVELSKASSDTTIELADVNLTVRVGAYPPVTGSTWNYLCVDSDVQDGNYSAELKGQTVALGSRVIVSMRFDTAQPFESGRYIYPNINMDVTGSFEVVGNDDLSGDLYSPRSGTIDLFSGTSTIDFDIFNLIMPSDLGLDAEIDGGINLNPNWLATPEAN